MGDRTSVQVTVLKEHSNTVLKEHSNIVEKFNIYWVDEEKRITVIFQLDDVNYGEVLALTELREQGIAYNFHWDSGDEYTAGTEYCRFNKNGEILIKQVDDDQIGKLCADNIAEILNSKSLMLDSQKIYAIQKYLKDAQDHWTEPSWDSQVDYGKMYKTIKLISP